jgi:hypothetical protein
MREYVDYIQRTVQAETLDEVFLPLMPYERDGFLVTNRIELLETCMWHMYSVKKSYRGTLAFLREDSFVKELVDFGVEMDLSSYGLHYQMKITLRCFDSNFRYYTLSEHVFTKAAEKGHPAFTPIKIIAALLQFRYPLETHACILPTECLPKDLASIENHAFYKMYRSKNRNELEPRPAVQPITTMENGYLVSTDPNVLLSNITEAYHRRHAIRFGFVTEDGSAHLVDVGFLGPPPLSGIRMLFYDTHLRVYRPATAYYYYSPWSLVQDDIPDRAERIILGIYELLQLRYPFHTYDYIVKEFDGEEPVPPNNQDFYDIVAKRLRKETKIDMD